MASKEILARVAGLFYAVNIGVGTAAAVAAMHRNPAQADLLTIVAAADYALVAILLAKLFEPAGKTLSWGVAMIALAGCGLSAAGALHFVQVPVNPLALFGIYCILLGALIWRTQMLPAVLGLLLAIGGLGWLTFAAPAASRGWMPWNMLPGVLAETLLTLWLLIFAVRNPTTQFYESSPA